MKSYTVDAILDGNRLVEIHHVFVPGEGTYYPTKEIAEREGYRGNGVSPYIETVLFNGDEYYSLNYRNVWE